MIQSQSRAVAAARFSLETEIAELKKLLERLDVQIETSLDFFLECQGRVVVSGLGKSGNIGAKISSTFSSTGTPSFFMHTTEALHGDFGSILAEDLLLVISNSGETTEVCSLAQMAKSWGTKVVAMTGNTDSTLAKISDVVLNTSISREADPLNLAPTSSAMLTLALGDAIASALMATREFSVGDFSRRHPAGVLGVLSMEVIATENSS